MKENFTIEDLKALNRNQVALLLAKNDKKRALDAKLILEVNNIMDKIAGENGITNINGEMNQASRKSQTVNLGEQLHALFNAVIESKGIKKNFEIATLVNNTPNNISCCKDYYVVVIKATTKGVYKISRDIIKSCDLIDLRLTLKNVLEYGVWVSSI